MHQYRLTIIVPVYNEEACLEALAEEMDGFFAEAGESSQVLFVNDGSTDRSQQVIETIW